MAGANKNSEPIRQDPNVPYINALLSHIPNFNEPLLIVAAPDLSQFCKQQIETVAAALIIDERGDPQIFSTKALDRQSVDPIVAGNRTISREKWMTVIKIDGKTYADIATYRYGRLSYVSRSEVVVDGDKKSLQNVADNYFYYGDRVCIKASTCKTREEEITIVASYGDPGTDDIDEEGYSLTTMISRTKQIVKQRLVGSIPLDEEAEMYFALNIGSEYLNGNVTYVIEKTETSEKGYSISFSQSGEFNEVEAEYYYLGPEGNSFRTFVIQISKLTKRPSPTELVTIIGDIVRTKITPDDEYESSVSKVDVKSGEVKVYYSSGNNFAGDLNIAGIYQRDEGIDYSNAEVTFEGKQLEIKSVKVDNYGNLHIDARQVKFVLEKGFIIRNFEVFE